MRAVDWATEGAPLAIALNADLLREGRYSLDPVVRLLKQMSVAATLICLPLTLFDLSLSEEEGRPCLLLLLCRIGHSIVSVDTLVLRIQLELFRLFSQRPYIFHGQFIITDHRNGLGPQILPLFKGPGLE